MAERMLNFTADEINEILEKAKKGGGGSGKDGKSAYEIAVEHGFIGTEEQWLVSLKGEDGRDGKDGQPGAKGEKGDTGATGPQGQPGQNAQDPIFSVDAKTLESTESATATVTGVYPNLNIEFGIPRGKSGGGGGGSELTPEQLDNIDYIPTLKNDVLGLHASKSDLGHTHAIAEVDELTTKIEDIYTKIEASKLTEEELEDVHNIPNIRLDLISLHAEKAELEHTHEKNEINGLNDTITDIYTKTLTEEQKTNVNQIPNLIQNVGNLTEEIQLKADKTELEAYAKKETLDDYAKKTELEVYAKKEEVPEVVDSLGSDDETKALSAKQGKVLKSLIEGGGGSSYDYIDVTSIGIKTGNAEGVKEANTEILKQYIDEKSTGSLVKTFYFPKGEYYFNSIEITDEEKIYKICLCGEELENGTSSEGVKIFTQGQSFITRTNTTGENSIKFDIKNMSIYSCTQTTEKALGTCFGVTENLNKSYSFSFVNVRILGFEYGFYTPGNANGSRANNVTFGHCVYGMYIKEELSDFLINNITLKNCLYGIRFYTCKNNCKISNMHVHVGFYSGLNDYTDSKENSYAFHIKGGGVFDTIFYEKTGSPKVNSYYRVIDYEGRSNSATTPVVIKNMPINYIYGITPKVLKGSCYTGGTPEEKPAVWGEIPAEQRLLYFPYGCIRFENCLENNTVPKDLLENLFEIGGGQNVLEGWGFYFAEKELIGNGLGMANSVITRFNSYFTGYGKYGQVEMYSYDDIPEENRTFNKNEIQPDTKVYTGTTGVHITGTITINNVDYYQDVKYTGKGPKLCIVGRKYNYSSVEVFKELIDIKEEIFNTFVTVNVDEFISCSDMYQVFLGYSIAGGGGELTDDGLEKVIYNLNIESCNSEWDGWQSNSRSYYSFPNQ